MSDPKYVNLYCFNPSCSVSIFNALTYSGIKTPLAKALEEESRCPVCGEEHVSMPVLGIKLLIYESLHTTVSPDVPINLPASAFI